jgi:hypothetical protein
MAQRRMFSKKITETDGFLDMPMSTQCLYFHLNMSADDDGFIGNAKTIKRMIGAGDDDLKLLLAKEFIIPFESGVVVIKDWKVHNYIRKDRYDETVYKEEKRQLTENENGQYEVGRPMVDQMDTQVRLGKVRLGKVNKDIEQEQKAISSASADGEYQNEFESIWKIYPNKKGKQQALKAYKKSRKNGTDRQSIESGVNQYAEYVKKNRIEIQFQKHGSTFFTQEAWADEYDVGDQNNKQGVGKIYEGIEF